MDISKYNSFYYEAAFSASATAYFNQVTSNGGSLTNAEKTYINTFIGALGTDFAEFDRLWIHGLSNSVAARTSLANPTSTMITAVNTPPNNHQIKFPKIFIKPPTYNIYNLD